MALLVTGSIGIDTLETPAGKADSVLGGSAIYFSIAASNFTDVRLVAAVGEDFKDQWLSPLKERRIDLAGIERRTGSKTFRWHGKYVGNMAEAETVDVQLNVLGEAGAPIPDQFRNSRCVFLANTHPTLQREVAEQLSSAELIVCDTMNLWIANETEELKKTLKVVHGIVLNDGEARQFTGEDHLVKAARAILSYGPRFVVIKKGENGSMLVSAEDLFLMPPYPTDSVVDPTGCGDSFAGALMGYLDAQGKFDAGTLRSALARGSIMGSFVIESFSVERAAAITPNDIEQRLTELRGMVRFE
jgi:sugar/nucleoside kinase (ribokinase family)